MTTLDPRVARSRERIVGAATQLLREGGAAALTIEAVAAHSGVAKTTIYRQFEDSDELHVEALKNLTNVTPIGDTGDLRHDVETFLQGFAAALRDSDFAKLIPSTIDAAERSERMHTLMVEMVAARRLPMQRRLRAAQRRGELARHANVELVITLLVAPLFEHRYFTRRRTTRAVVTSIVNAVLVPLLSTPSR